MTPETRWDDPKADPIEDIKRAKKIIEKGYIYKKCDHWLYELPNGICVCRLCGVTFTK